MRFFSRKAVEVAAVVGTYVAFCVIAIFGGQTTMSVDIVNPSDGIQFHHSPVELAARITIRGVPLCNVTARFWIGTRAGGDLTVGNVTGRDGIARILVPASSGNFTWQVAAIKDGYPTIVSRSGSFSITLSLIVDGLQPSSSILAVSPVDFKARVSDSKGHPVESANVTFYLDLKDVGSSLTNQNGIANMTTPALAGRHVWFASASKQGEGGVSGPIKFIVGQLGSLAKGDFDGSESSPQLCWNDIAAISRVEQEPASQLPH